MKRFSLVGVLSLALVAPVLAAPSPDVVFGDGWAFNASTDIFSFNPLKIDMVYGDTADALVAPGYVRMDDMLVGGGPGAWTLSGGTISIGDGSGSETYLTGTLGSGDLVPVGSIAGAYTAFYNDIAWTSINNSIGSEVVDNLYAAPGTDLSLAFTFANAMSFEEMLQSESGSFKGGTTGSLCAVPAPGAILLSGLGAGVVGWLRRRRSL